MTLAIQDLPHSLALMYEDLTEHRGFQRSSDESKGKDRVILGDARVTALGAIWSRDA